MRGREEHELPPGPSLREAGGALAVLDGAQFAVIIGATGLAGRYLVGAPRGHGIRGVVPHPWPGASPVRGTGGFFVANCRRR